MRNPIRRNKNIGKTQGGRVKVGKASEKWSRKWFADDKYSLLSGESGAVQVFKDNPSRDFFHPCEPDEYLKVLKLMPVKLGKKIRAIILPRITKHDVEYGVEARRKSSCIILNPFPKTMEIVWSVEPEAKVQRHNEHWCAEPFKLMGKLWVQKWEMEEIRRYYLFHLFLHELGHVNQPWFNSLDRREEFAENFSLEWGIKLGALKNPRGKSRKFSPRKVGDTPGYEW